MSVRNSNTYDNLLLLKDAGAVAVTGAAQVAGTPRVIDVGLADIGRVKAVIDTSALTTGGAAPETYTVAIQGSETLAFTVPVQLGALSVIGAGRNEAFFNNVQNSVIYRYLRAFTTVGGTAPSVNSTIFIAKA